MGKSRVLEYEGREVAGTDIPFQVVQDGSIVVEAEDGARIRIRPLVVNVIKTNERNSDGERVYIVQHITHIVTDEPAKEDRK